MARLARKSFLIHALKSLLGTLLLVAAPTGVAALNIGGVTLHSFFPLPRSRADAADVTKLSPMALKNLRLRLASIRWLIIDELGMVGQKLLGMIDALLRLVLDRPDVPFGGLYVLIFGDHGQLPPVQDFRMFDTRGLIASDGRVLPKANRWRLRGLRAYQSITDVGSYPGAHVFFLTCIQRVTSGKSAEESALLEAFKEIQLRLRDGELTHDDCSWLRKHCSFDANQAYLARATPYNLVATRAQRDTVNAEHLLEKLNEGQPGFVNDAINNNAKAQNALESELQLPNRLHLCRGARIMVRKNLSVALGVVNGLLGDDYDLLVDSHGVLAAVSMVVKRAPPGIPGYRGPSFLSPAEAPDIDHESFALITFGWYSETHALDTTCSRKQIPAILASAVTIHKSQGLTLDAVICDPDDDERSAGLTFTASTRTTHPGHLALRHSDGTFPSDERLMEVIASKPDLQYRKLHDQHLRVQAVLSARKLLQSHKLQPPPSALTVPDAVEPTAPSSRAARLAPARRG